MNDRLNILVDGFSEAPSQSIPQVFEEWSATKAAYRFFANDRVSHDALVAGQRRATAERLWAYQGQFILMLQDSTTFNFQHHPAKEEMGPLENEFTNGFIAHSTFVVSHTGIPLGVWQQQVWARDPEETGKSQKRHERPFEEKESYKWVRGLPEFDGEEEEPTWVTVCDREGHIYDFLVAVNDRGGEFIVRASKGRSTTVEGQALFDAVAEWSCQQTFTIQLPRRPDRTPREATLELRFGTVRLRRPQRSAAAQPTQTVQVVEVREMDPPGDEEGVHWVLLTSLPVTTIEQARQIVEWYTRRWLIERFHYVLKSGCRLEERQLKSRTRLENLLGVFNEVAWRLLWLTYQSRQTPDAPCTSALSQDEWQALYAYTHATTDLPPEPPTLHQATRWIGKLGGFLGRKGDGEPGVKVLWRGWIRLQDIVSTWRLFRPAKDMGNA